MADAPGLPVVPSQKAFGCLRRVLSPSLLIRNSRFSVRLPTSDGEFASRHGWICEAGENFPRIGGGGRFPNLPGNSLIRRDLIP